jgi:pimeloyl-ACP methyl ester carboxylesterase
MTATSRVVLVHAGIADARMWERQVDVLRERGFDVRAPDLPGFGDEPVPEQAFSFVEHVRRHLPAILVGNSFGGRIALETALAYPDDVARLVLVDPALADHQWSDDLVSYWTAEEELLERGDLDGATEVTLETFVDPAQHDVVRPMQRRAYELQSAAPEPEVLWPEPKPLSTLRPPTLVVVGEQDRPDFRAIATRIADEAPNARLEVIAGARHLPSLEQPDAFDRLLLEFLSR